jgi:hypothetical protein
MLSSVAAVATLSRPRMIFVLAIPSPFPFSGLVAARCVGLRERSMQWLRQGRCLEIELPLKDLPESSAGGS